MVEILLLKFGEGVLECFTEDGSSCGSGVYIAVKELEHRTEPSKTHVLQNDNEKLFIDIIRLSITITITYV